MQIIREVCLPLYCLTTFTLQLEAQTASPVFRSASQAVTVLRDGLAAVGGLAALEGAGYITREYRGTQSDPAQYPRAPQPGGAPLITSRSVVTRVRDYRTGDAVDVVSSTIGGGQTISTRSVVRGDSGFSFAFDAGIIRSAPPPPMPIWRSTLLNGEVEGLLLSAWQQRGTARWIGRSLVEGRTADVVTFTDRAQGETAIYFDAATHLPVKRETVADDPIRGDVVNETLYTDWRAAGSIKVPYTVESRTNGQRLQRLQLEAVRFGPVADSLFQIPAEGVAASPWTTRPLSLGGDLYVIPSRYQSAFVVFDDYVFVLEPGGSAPEARATIAAAKEIAPTKPIRYVLATHAHFDHLAGVREYAAIGATFLTTRSAKQVIESAARAAHTLQPDELALHPRKPIVEVVEGDERVLRDGTHEVRLYSLGPTSHVNEMLFAYIPGARTLFEADALDIPEPGHTRAGGEDTQRLAQRISELALRVDRIIPVHGRTGTMDDLRASLAKRTAP